MEEKMRFNKAKAAKVLLFILLIFIVGGTGGVYFQQFLMPRIRANATLSRIDLFKKATENITVINKTEQITVKEDDSINELALQATNAVVNVVSVTEQGLAAPAKTIGVRDRQALKTTSKSGTGVIGTSDGLIITYRSAILEKNAKYTVFLHDNSSFEAVLVGVDEMTNLAFLKIDASGLPVIPFAQDSNIFPGKKMIAVGSSFGESQVRFAAGILSGNKKTFNLGGMALSSTEKLEGVFQLDFNENNEYVGGPVVTYNGELAGINGSVLLDNQLVYFQIPAEMVRQSLDLAARDELKNRPFLGAYYVPLTREYAVIHGTRQERGALIYSASGKQGLAILAGSPAEKAGLRINDIVLALNGQEINLDNPFSNLLGQHKKGEQLELTVLRGEQELKLPVSL